MNEEPQRTDLEVRIDATFRNGSVTAVGIILGFSLGFEPMGRQPHRLEQGRHRRGDPHHCGEAKAFADLLSTRSLFAAQL